MTLTPGQVFEEAVQKGASDVHVSALAPLLYRIDGELKGQTSDELKPQEVEAFVRSVLGERWQRFEKDREIDLSYGLQDGTRLRVNCHFERGNPGLVARIIPKVIPTLEDVQLQGLVEDLCALPDGLVLCTGPTGAGKSTTLAAMIRYITEHRAVSVVTLEDPIEFLFPRGKGILRQRELGADFGSFPEALRRILRQDPNVIMVGEMRDLETIAAALTLAETGHLIFATLHTPNAVQTVDRIVDIFPPHQQPQIRVQLSMSLKAVIAQRLLPKEGGGRIAAREMLRMTPAVANIIRDNRIQELKTVIQTGGSAGMFPFEKDLKRLQKAGLIAKETADAEW